MRVNLVIVGGERGARQISLQLPAVIGRGRTASLTLPHPLVSRNHCELFEQEGRVRVRDLGSLNGTYVANQRVKEAELPDGELLTVGSVTFRVSLPHSKVPFMPHSSSKYSPASSLASPFRFMRSDVRHSTDTWDFPMRQEQPPGNDMAIDRKTKPPADSSDPNDSDDSLGSFLNGLQ